MDAYRFSFTATDQGVDLYAEWYVFTGSGHLIEGFYLRPNNTAEDQDSLVMDSMLTMRFEEQENRAE